MMRTNLLYCLLALLVLAGCGGDAPRYKIALSQCVGGSWREKVNQEVRSAQHLYNNVVEVEILNAENDSHRQSRQIDSLAQSDVNLIVVAPNEYTPLSPAVSRAFKRGIPVVLFDRKINSNDYTAYIGGDNVEIGASMAHYALSLVSDVSDHAPCVFEITGGKHSSPALDRHKGFASVMKASKVTYRYVDTDWSDDQIYKAMTEYLKTHGVPDVVFCHSDIAALTARRAAADAHVAERIKFLGIDGLPGPGEGIEAVSKGLLAGTYIYPTHGEEIVKLALDILQGKPYKRENSIHGIIVTPDNASIMLRTSLEMQQQSNDLMTLQDKLEALFGVYHTQHMLLIAGIIAIILLLITVVAIYRIVVIVRRVNRKEKMINREQTRFYTNARHQLRTPLTLIEGPLKELSDSTQLKARDRTLVDILQRNVHELSHIVNDVLNFETMATADESGNVASQTQQGRDRVTDDSAAECTPSGCAHLGMAQVLAKDVGSEVQTVLVVDDNADMRCFLRTLLADRYYVLEAEDGENGLRLARESVPDLIVSDVMMPVMDGLTLCQKIKTDPMTSHIPVILLTARSTTQQLVEGLDHGADAYMTKPFSAEVLLARIDNLLKSRRQLRHLFDAGQVGQKEESQLSAPDRKFIDRLKEAFQKHLGESDLKMDDLGAELGLSRVQLYRKVKVLTGQAPAELLRQTRVRKAHALILQTDLSLSEIAYDTGFSSPGYFSKCFRDEYGITPSELRKQREEQA